MIGTSTLLIGELVVLYYLSVILSSVSFVDRDMLMRFHFGLGVGHVYSHRRNAQAMHQRDDSAVQRRVEESDDEDSQSRDENESMQDDEDDDDVQMMDPADQWYGSSQESLVEQFEAMYESELELDYEN